MKLKQMNLLLAIMAASIIPIGHCSIASASEILDAAENGDLEKVKTLLAADSSLINTRVDNSSRATVLMIAVHYEKPDVAKFLIEKGADVNAKTAHGQTALFEASAYGELDVVKMLLAKGADVNFVVHDDSEGDDPGCTPLLLAAENGQLEVVKLLLEKGADVNAKSSYNTIHECATPLIGACEVAKDFGRLGGGLPPGTRVVTTKKHGYLEVVKLLLEKGAKVDVKNNFGNTALLIASGNGQSDVVKLLLDKGASVDLGNNQGVTPLLMAAQYGDVDVITPLLAKGANPNTAMSGQKAWTPISIAQVNHFTNVVELLQNAVKH
jgi:ankyrin repeat protein